MAKKSKTQSAGMRKAVKKAEKLGAAENKRAGHGYTVHGKDYSTGGEIGVETTQYTPKGDKINKPVVMGLSDSTGEIRTFPIKGKLSKFNQGVKKAESRATAFINASTEGKTFEGR